MPCRALAKVRQRPGTSRRWPTRGMVVPRAQAGWELAHGIPAGLPCPVMRNVGPPRQAARLGLALHCTGSSVPIQGTSPAAILGVLGWHGSQPRSPSTCTRQILLPPMAPWASPCSEPGPHSPCAGRCCLGSFGLAGPGAERDHAPRRAPGLCSTDLTVTQGWCLLLAEAEGRKRNRVLSTPRLRSGHPPASKVTGKAAASRAMGLPKPVPPGTPQYSAGWSHASQWGEGCRGQSPASSPWLCSQQAQGNQEEGQEQGITTSSARRAGRR